MASDHDTKTRILEAAGPIFAEKGFDGATAREICDAAGVNIAAVNYYFGSKEQLYVEAVKHAIPAIGTDFMQTAGSTDAPAEERLAGFIRTLVAHMVGEPQPAWKSKLIMREMLEQSTGCREYFLEHVRNNLNALLSILDELLPAATPRHRRYQTAFSIIAQCVHYRGAFQLIQAVVPAELHRRYFTSEHIAKHIIQVVFAALGLGQTLPECLCEEAAEKREAPPDSPNGTGASGNGASDLPARSNRK